MKITKRSIFAIFAIFLFSSLAYIKITIAQDHKHSESCSHSQTKADENHTDHTGHNHEKSSLSTEDKEHEEHEHEKQLNPNDTDEHDHTGHSCSGHGDGDEAGVKLSTAQKESAKIKISHVGSGELSRELKVPAEITLNADNLAMVSPRTFGIVKQVMVTEGSRVSKGELLAIVDCPDIGTAKLEYLSALAEVSNACLNFERAKTVKTNTEKLLKLLKTNPDLDKLRQTSFGELGENRSRLIGDYAAYIQTQSDFVRLKQLIAKRLSSQQDFQRSQTDFKKAAALYEDACDVTAFKVKQDYQESVNKLRVAEFHKNNAARNLQILGVEPERIAELEKVFTDTGYASKPEEYFCGSCAGMECPPDKKQPFLFHSDHSLAANLIAAPISGTVISRNCVKGERLEEGKVIFQIADLRTVWVDLKIPMTNLNSVKSGDRVLIISNDLKLETYGEISFIFPIVDERTRAAKARIILQNTGQVWKPGTFVSAYLKIDSTKADVVVPLSSIQRIGNEMVVFVPVENGFNTKVVKVGMKDSKNAQIISGLKKGEKFVSEGSFQLKATMVTSGLDPHAGHGH